jgi:hypothetical protein
MEAYPTLNDAVGELILTGDLPDDFLDANEAFAKAIDS